MKYLSYGFISDSGDEYDFVPPSPTEEYRGGIKAKKKTTENVEVAVGDDDKLYVPEYPKKTSDLENDSGYIVKPETAKVGQIFKVQSVNEDGSLVLEAVDMPSGGGGVEDVQIDGTSIVGEDGIANVPYATASRFGAVRLQYDNAGGLAIDGMVRLVIYPAHLTDIDGRIQHHRPITSDNLDYAVKAAMTDGVGAAWTDTEKTGAWSRLSSIKTTMDEVAVAGARYLLLGEQTEVSVVLPDDALTGQEITVAWYNGKTPATLSITGNMLDFDFTPAANTRSEISALFDGTYWSVIGMSQNVPVDTTTEEVVASE